MELPQYTLGRWIKFKGNVVISIPLAYSGITVVKSILKTFKDNVILITNVPENFKNYPTYTPQNPPENVTHDSTLVIYTSEPDYLYYKEYTPHKTIFVLEYGFSLAVFNGILNYFTPKLIAYYYSDRRYGYQFTAQKVELSNLQNKYYENAETELKKLQYGNMVYPKLLQKLLEIPKDQRTEILKHDLKTISRNTEISVSDLEDILVSSSSGYRVIPDNEWIISTFLEELQYYSIKFATILNIVDPTERTVIFTRFADRYGVYALSTLLESYGRNVYTITKQMPDSEQVKVVKEFNINDGSMLVTNTAPDNIFKNIDKIIITEGNNIENIEVILNLVNNTLSFPRIDDTIEILFMISNSIDSEKYKKFMQIQENQELAWEAAISKSDELFIDPDTETYSIRPQIYY